ncbi:hypothetical protein CULCOIPH003_21020 [Corynebacterium ulcerans]|uniref:Uncharacterized protein n=1 Tax=Corynebacterium ulcerans TaxID=65058 RepID=A0ABD0BL39_CORUL|nr:hypothetical protein CULCOIPH003_21020 [Corynebacterium ulcerans]GJJ41601.1 hypothetical protein CULCOIPH004_20120 [Corynebacterium ulcerans]GJJ43431.1 hypothetical protein CULCOIPH005_16200 [Corynebacterium ulcerans]
MKEDIDFGPCVKTDKGYGPTLDVVGLTAASRMWESVLLSHRRAHGCSSLEHSGRYWGHEHLLCMLREINDVDHTCDANGDAVEPQGFF